jgi:glycosyltransferase involved in cell wall biosynthesis
MSPLVTLVIPAYNEEHNVRALYNAVQRSLPASEEFEMLFVDDGSVDGTAAEVRRLRANNPAVRLIRFGRNFGHQAALLAGLHAMRGRAVIMLDCDLQHPPELLPKMLDAWRGGAKVVQMIRTETAGAGFFKSISSGLFYRFLNLLSETPVVPGAADYQLLDRSVVDAVLQFRDRSPFLRGIVAWLGFPAMRIEYAAGIRHAGKSRYTLSKMVRLALRAVTGLSAKPLRLSFYLGLGTSIVCLIYAVFAIIAMLEGKTVQGWTSVIVVVTFVGAVQLVSIGILGEYLARVYEQTRGIPHYVIVESDTNIREASDN